MNKTAKHSEGLQQFLGLLIMGLEKGTIYRKNGALFIDLFDTFPLALLTGVMNSLGRDPLGPLDEIQVIFDRIRKLFGVRILILRVQWKNYRKIAFDGKKSWLSLPSDQKLALPCFKNVKWDIYTGVGKD
jgi:hypothetical protein